MPIFLLDTQQRLIMMILIFLIYNLYYDSIIEINKPAVGIYVLMPMCDDNSYRVYSYVFQIVVSYLMYQMSLRLWYGTTVSPSANNNYYHWKGP